MLHAPKLSKRSKPLHPRPPSKKPDECSGVLQQLVCVGRQSAHALPPLEQADSRGCLKCMQISTLVCASLVLAAMATSDSAASDQQVESFSQGAATFLPQAESPVLFEGRVVEVDSGRMACSVTNSRDFTYSVDTVLFGFAPPGRVKVAFPGCAKSQAPHAYTGAVLVLATFYGHDLWGSRRELVIPATRANLREAQSLLNADLRKRISQFMRHHGPPHNNRVLVFEGIVRDPVPHLQEPIVCKGQPLFAVNYDVEHVLRGEWTVKQMVVHFGACSNLPDPPIRAGQGMIVFAILSQLRSQVYGDLNLLFAPEQMVQVRAALGSREVSHSRSDKQVAGTLLFNRRLQSSALSNSR